MSQASWPCDYDSLSIMQKVEVFEMALKHTAGLDLYKVRMGMHRAAHWHCIYRQ